MATNNITFFKSLYENKPYYTSVAAVLAQIKGKPSQLDLINQIRNSRDKEERNELKKQLGVICFCGKFSERKISAMKEYSRLIILDFDNCNVAVKKQELILLPYVHACWLSPSGDGLKALVKVSSDAHLAHFRALSKEITGTDISGKDLARACFMSFDPLIYINDHSDIYTKVIEAVYNDEQKLAKLKSWLENKGDSFISGQRNNFLVKLAGAANRFGLSKEFVAAHFQSNYTSSDFSIRESQSVVDSVYNRYAQEHGTQSFDEPISESKAKEILSTELITTDVIYLKDVEQDMLDDYDNGITGGRTSHYPSMDAIYRPLPGDLNVLSGIGGYGKALCIETDIPTPTGWKKLKDIFAGDIVFDEKGNQCSVTAVTPIQNNRPCYKIVFADNTEIIADEQHEWLTSTDKSIRSARHAKKNNRIKPRELKNKGVDQTHKRTFPSVVTTKEIEETLLVYYGGRARTNHGVEFAEPIVCEEKELSIHPYVLGAWLGDGTSDSGGFTCGDDEIVDNIRKLGFVVNRYKAKYHYGILGLLVKLREIGVLHNKHIPMNYLRGSIEQRKELLFGLMDTDGYVDKRSQYYEFTSVKKEMAYQVFELITSLGLKATIVESDAKIYGRIVSKRYRISFKSEWPVFRLKRKIDRCGNSLKNKRRFIKACYKVDSVPVKCIEVDSPNRLYLCTKSFIATHNSAIQTQFDLVAAVMEKEKTCVFGPENFPPTYWYREIVRSLIGKPVEQGAANRMTREEYKLGMNFVREHFYYVYPKTMPTPEYIMERFIEVIIKHGVKRITLDPWNQLLHVMQKRDDIYLSETLSNFERFAQAQGIFLTIIAHPNRISKKADGNYDCPDIFDLNGGAVWNARITNMTVYHRPFYGVDKSDPSVEFHSKKIKRQMLSGIPGTISLDYVRQTGRFYDGGYSPLTDFKL